MRFTKIPRQMTHKQSDHWLFDEPNLECRYCGMETKPGMKYCSDDCRKKDSVWHTDD